MTVDEAVDGASRHMRSYYVATYRRGGSPRGIRTAKGSLGARRGRLPDMRLVAYQFNEVAGLTRRETRELAEQVAVGPDSDLTYVPELTWRQVGVGLRLGTRPACGFEARPLPGGSDGDRRRADERGVPKWHEFGGHGLNGWGLSVADYGETPTSRPEFLLPPRRRRSAGPIAARPGRSGAQRRSACLPSWWSRPGIWPRGRHQPDSSGCYYGRKRGAATGRLFGSYCRLAGLG